MSRADLHCRTHGRSSQGARAIAASTPARVTFTWPDLLLRIAIAITVILSSGCAYTGGVQDYFRKGMKIGPEYCKPAAPIADDWIDSYAEQVKSELPESPEWWNVFDDPQMTELVYAAYQGNIPLQSAAFRVLEARARLGVAVGSIFPQQQQAFGDFTRQQVSRNTINGAAPFLPRAFDNWRAGFDAAWELDVWGKFRRNIEAANADLDASIEDYDAVLVCLLAETAAAYIELRTFEQRLRFAGDNVVAQRQSLRIADARERLGQSTMLDVEQARSTVANTASLIPFLEAGRRDAQIRLCILMGIPPRELPELNIPGFELPTLDQARLFTDLTMEPTPQVDYRSIIPTPRSPEHVVALGIPADLLRRRPDVLRAERQAAAQSARIGVAATDWFPSVTISGSIQVEAENFSDLFRQSSTAGFLMPGFRWNVLNYNRVLNNVRAQDARFQQLVRNYQQAVLNANAEVESAVINWLKAQQRVEVLAKAVVASQASVNLAQTQWEAGQTDFNRVAVLQSQLAEQQDGLAATQGELSLSLIAVYKALGGGWQIRMRGGFGPPPMPQAAPQEQIDLPPLPEPEETTMEAHAPEVIWAEET